MADRATDRTDAWQYSAAGLATCVVCSAACLLLWLGVLAAGIALLVLDVTTPGGIFMIVVGAVLACNSLVSCVGGPALVALAFVSDRERPPAAQA